MQPKIKICGITGAGDAALAERCGAHYIGLVCEIGYSPRCISRAAAADITRLSRLPVILLLDNPASEIVDIVSEVHPFGIQLISDLTPDDIALVKKQTACSLWLPVRVPVHVQQVFSVTEQTNRLAALKRAGIDVIILDAMVDGMKGGTGTICDWNIAARIVAASPLPVFLAGGINPENAAQAITLVQPAGIDVSSGVEKTPGVKHAGKIKRLVNEVRSTT